ncbi:rna-directed dna polymerase from mobile element hypothetical protein [Limosa lapponica baueri]|uniref:Rna-directed dna polymerase from mobile element jockey-like n=1 Tax=Limosa lapponica baueri TaxID=1758121 RepID=A0A2I0THS7_LIMLA|nr:rna-directed dna polymerase from mobile element hypothetical protein [Limosa lapponica baueri]
MSKAWKFLKFAGDNFLSQVLSEPTRKDALLDLLFLNREGLMGDDMSPKLEGYDCGSSDFPFVDTETIRVQLYQLNVHKSMGPDGIHPRVLKELVDVTAGPLSIIYQRSWESGEVLADWKLANVIPIYKKGNEGRPRKLQT